MQSALKIINDVFSNENEFIFEFFTFTSEQIERFETCAVTIDALISGNIETEPFDDESAFIDIEVLRIFNRAYMSEDLTALLDLADALALYYFNSELTIPQVALICDMSEAVIRARISKLKIKTNYVRGKPITIDAKELRENLIPRVRHALVKM